MAQPGAVLGYIFDRFSQDRLGLYLRALFGGNRGLAGLDFDLRKLNERMVLVRARVVVPRCVLVPARPRRRRCAATFVLVLASVE